MQGFFRKDVVFLHAPSVFDFRKGTTVYGPVSDVIPSSHVFEMYPVGITSIADTLERVGYHVQIINAAYRMLRQPEWDPEREISRLRPRLWAVDMHWLPHAHGALGLAALIKKHHPNTPVLMGGLTASYYHEELIASPHVDFVIRGDSAEKPVLDLLRCMRTGASYQDVPNLTWKRSGAPVINPLTHVPTALDELDVPSYRYVMRSVYKYWNLHNIVPYLRWLEYPMTAVLTARGCNQRCSVCGGSNASYRQICNRGKPAYRSPAKVAEDIRFISRFSRAPVFVIHDIRMGGKAYANHLLQLLKKQRTSNELVLELFYPGNSEFFARVNESVPRYSLELTLETHDLALRRLNGKFPYTNAELERTIESALANGCRRMDIFFMVGIPHQTRESALESMAYARHLLERYGRDGRLRIYTAPLAPFLDPGSPAFENPERYGYRLRARTLAEHKERLTMPTWTQILNYESVTLPPDSLAETTYEAATLLVEAKAELGLMPMHEARSTIASIAQARDVLRHCEEASLLPEPDRTHRLTTLHIKAQASNRNRLYSQTDFVNWGEKRRQLKPLGLAVLMVELFFEELSLAYRRLASGVYDWS